MTAKYSGYTVVYIRNYTELASRSGRLRQTTELVECMQLNGFKSELSYTF